MYIPIIGISWDSVYWNEFPYLQLFYNAPYQMNFVYIKTTTNSFSNQFLETEHVAYHMYSYFKVSIFYRAKFPLLSWLVNWYIIVLIPPQKKTNHLTKDTCNFTVDCLLNTVDRETRSKTCHWKTIQKKKVINYLLMDWLNEQVFIIHYINII